MRASTTFLLGRDTDGDTSIASVTLSRTGSGWRQTDALAEDDTSRSGLDGAAYGRRALARRPKKHSIRKSKSAGVP
jgi:hypothetical protein